MHWPHATAVGSRPFAEVQSPLPRLRREPEGGAAPGLRLLALRFATGSLRCSALWPRRRTRCVRCAHCAQTPATSQITRRAAHAATRPPLLGCAQSPRRRTALGPASRVGGPHVEDQDRCPQGDGWGAGTAPCAQPRSAGFLAARVSALGQHACGRLCERSERSERSEFGHRPGSRASQGTLAQRGPAVGDVPAPRPPACSRRCRHGRADGR